MELCNKKITKEKVHFFSKTKDDLSSSYFLHLSRGLFRLWDVACLGDYMTHSQLLEGLKCESQTKNNGRARSRGTLPGSQHYRRV